MDSSELFFLKFRLQLNYFLGILVCLLLKCFDLLLRVFELDLCGDQFMFQIVQLLFLCLKLFLQNGNLLLRLEIIVGNVQLKQDSLRIHRLSPEAVNLIVFVNLIVDIGGYLLEIFLAFIAAQRKDLAADDYFRICFG